MIIISLYSASRSRTSQALRWVTLPEQLSFLHVIISYFYWQRWSQSLESAGLTLGTGNSCSPYPEWGLETLPPENVWILTLNVSSVHFGYRTTEAPNSRLCVVITLETNWGSTPMSPTASPCYCNIGWCGK